MRTILMKAHDVYTSEDESSKENASDDSESQNGEDANAQEEDLLMIC